MDINTSLLRERFVIQEKGSGEGMRRVALSNRMILKLQAGTLPEEVLTIRTKTMHSCARLCAQLTDNYERHGPIIPRVGIINWDEIWDSTLSDYDRRYYKDNWCAIYDEGKTLFSKGKYHKFFDVLEHFDYRAKGSYEKSIPVAQGAFRQAGKEVKIEHDGNVAMVAIGNRTGGRCSMLTRGADHASTFNIAMGPKEDDNIHVMQLFSSAGDFLEATQLCYTIGLIKERIESGAVDKFSDKAEQIKHAEEELKALDAKIDSLENRHRVRYRPERPNFELLIQESEREAREKLFDLDDGGYVD